MPALHPRTHLTCQTPILRRWRKSSWEIGHREKKLGTKAWLKLTGERIVPPQALGKHFGMSNPLTDSPRKTRLTEFMRKRFLFTGMDQTIQEIVSRCQACQQTNTPRGYRVREWDSSPGRCWEVDFTEIKTRAIWIQVLSLCMHFVDGGGGVLTKTDCSDHSQKKKKFKT